MPVEIRAPRPATTVSIERALECPSSFARAPTILVIPKPEISTLVIPKTGPPTLVIPNEVRDL